MIRTPQELPFLDFKARADIIPLGAEHGRKAEVLFAGHSIGFVDALGDEGLRQAHRREVQNALYANTDDAPDCIKNRPLPCREAVLDYPKMMEMFPELSARIIAAGSDEVLPGATQEEIITVMMQDIVGDYDLPEEVPEWAWIEAHASFAHAKNGTAGVWEFILNLSRTFDDIPERLAPVLIRARRKHASYLLIHQGT